MKAKLPLDEAQVNNSEYIDNANDTDTVTLSSVGGASWSLTSYNGNVATYDNANVTGSVLIDNDEANNNGVTLG